MRSMWAPRHKPSIVPDFGHRRLDLFLNGNRSYTRKLVTR